MYCCHLSLILSFTLVLGELKNYISKGEKKKKNRVRQRQTAWNAKWGQRTVRNRHTKSPTQSVNMSCKFASEFSNGRNNRWEYEVQDYFWQYNRRNRPLSFKEKQRVSWFQGLIKISPVGFYKGDTGCVADGVCGHPSYHKHHGVRDSLLSLREASSKMLTHFSRRNSERDHSKEIWADRILRLGNLGITSCSWIMGNAGREKINVLD